MLCQNKMEFNLQSHEIYRFGGDMPRTVVCVDGLLYLQRTPVARYEATDYFAECDLDPQVQVSG